MTMTLPTTSPYSGVAAESYGGDVGMPQIPPQLMKLLLKLVENIVMDMIGEMLAGQGAGSEEPAGQTCGRPAAASPPAGHTCGQPTATPAPANTPVDSWVGPKPTGTEAPPPGKSAQDIVAANPTLAQLDPKAQDMLKKQYPAYQTDPNQAWQASRALDYIKSSKTAKGDVRDASITNNGKIEGFSKDHDAYHGSEAGLFKDFCENGNSALKDDHQLDPTTNDHVRTDGSTRDNAAVYTERAGKALVFLPGLSNVLKGAGGADRDHAVSAGDVIKGGFGGITRTWKNDIKGIEDGFKKGKVSPWAMIESMYQSNVEDGVTDE